MDNIVSPKDHHKDAGQENTLQSAGKKTEETNPKNHAHAPQEGVEPPQKETLVLLSDGLTEVVVSSRKSSLNRLDSESKLDPPPYVGVDSLGRPTPCKSIDDYPDYTSYEAEPLDREGGVNGVERCHASCIAQIETIQTHVHKCLENNHKYIVWALIAGIVVAFLVYLGFAIWTDVGQAKVVLSFTGFIVVVLLLRLFSRFCGKRLDTLVCTPIRALTHTKPCLYLKW